MYRLGICLQEIGAHSNKTLDCQSFVRLLSSGINTAIVSLGGYCQDFSEYKEMR